MKTVKNAFPITPRRSTVHNTNRQVPKYAVVGILTPEAAEWARYAGLEESQLSKSSDKPPVSPMCVDET